VPKNPTKPQHRRIYVTMLIKQLTAELKSVKTKVKTIPERPQSDSGYRAMQKDFIFNRIRARELRKELAALKAEVKTSGKEKADINVAL
jgi:hypothetical protein